MPDVTNKDNYEFLRVTINIHSVLRRVWSDLCYYALQYYPSAHEVNLGMGESNCDLRTYKETW